MKKTIIIGIAVAVLAIGFVFGFSYYTASASKDRADKALVNIMDLNLGAIYDSMSDSVKSKYKDKSEFVEKFPLNDAMNPENETRFISKTINNGVAKYDYFLPGTDNPKEGYRVSISVAYSAFDSKIRDVNVQEDTAPLQ